MAVEVKYDGDQVVSFESADFVEIVTSGHLRLSRTTDTGANVLVGGVAPGWVTFEVSDVPDPAPPPPPAALLQPNGEVAPEAVDTSSEGQ